MTITVRLPAEQGALAHRDKGCRFPGCLNQLYVDAHHIRHWADGGETRIDNLVLLCRHHHGLLHERGFTLERSDDGNLLFFQPDGELLPELPKQPLRVRDIEAIVAETGADVSAETSRSLRDGSRMDLDKAVGGLMDLNGRNPGRPPSRIAAFTL